MIGAQVEWRDTVVSTQDEAHHLAGRGAPHGTAIAARAQTGGRGTRGRPWSSAAGGLWISVICRPEAGGPTEIVGLRAGLSLAGYLETLLGPRHHIALKWPNDLYLGDRKVGGVLAEARWQGERLGWMVIGVGINISNEIPEQLAGGADRLASAGVDLAPEALAEPVAEIVARASRIASPLDPLELSAFEGRDWLKGRRLALPQPGVADGITSTGRLRVRTEAGIVEVLGSVQLAGEA